MYVRMGTLISIYERRVNMSEESKNTSAKSEKVNQNVPKETGSTPNKKKKQKKKKSLVPAPIEKGYLNSQQVYIPDEEKNKVKEPIAEVHQEDNLELQALPFRERQKAKRERLKKHMEGMTGQEKFLYLASYYKWKVLITISVIIIAISPFITTSALLHWHMQSLIANHRKILIPIFWTIIVNSSD